MIHLDKWMSPILSDITAAAAIIAAGILINWICQSIFRWFARHKIETGNSHWHSYLVKRHLGHHALLIIPGLVMYMLPYLFYEKGDSFIRLMHRADIVYLLIVMIMIANAILLAFLDFYSTTEKNRSRPLQGLIQALQVMLYFVGAVKNIRLNDTFSIFVRHIGRNGTSGEKHIRAETAGLHVQTGLQHPRATRRGSGHDAGCRRKDPATF